MWTPRALLPICLACLAGGMSRADAADSITVYRCTDPRGKVALRDSPCPNGQRQTTRELVRPVDPPQPRRLEPVTVTAPAPPAATVAQYVVINAPRPMYECVAPDNSTYTSESAEGNPRWMPLWALDYPVLAQRDTYRPGGASVRYRDGRIDARFHSGGHGQRVVPTIAAYGNAGTWVRDECHALPQQEVCARLIDRRDALRRRFFNAQPSERERLSLEERGINARLASDCGRS